MTPKTKRRCDSFDISKGKNTPSVKENLFFLDAKRLGVPALEFFFKNQFARRRRAIRTRFWPASKVLRVLSGNSKALTFKVGQKLRQMLLSLTHSAPGDSWFCGKASWRNQKHYNQKKTAMRKVVQGARVGIRDVFLVGNWVYLRYAAVNRFGVALTGKSKITFVGIAVLGGGEGFTSAMLR